MSWVRNYRSPPNSLVLFQVYQRFAPITDFRGPVWRYQVEEDVCLQCHLLPAARRGSFLHIRRQPTLAITPPLLHIEGQMEAAFPDQLPLLEWLAQGTVWWLRNLGSVDVDPALRMLLFSSLLDLDQQRFPRLFEAVAYHPIVPLCDGRWISLQTLRQAPCAYLARPQQGVSLPGYVDGGPVVQHLLGFERLQEFLDQPLHPLPLLDQTPPTLPPPPAWSYSLPTTCGPALLSPLKYRDGNCLWLFREHDWYVFGPLFPGIPISLQIKVDESADRNLDHVPDKLRQAVQIALLKHGHSVLRLLPDTPQGFSTACALVKAMLDHNHAVRDDILQRCWGDGLTLQQVVLGQTSLESFSLSHPVRLLTTPENQAESEAPIHSLFRLSWSQKCSQGRAHLQFRPERDGICHWNVYYGEIQVLKHSQPLWTQWPLSLAVHFHLLNKPRQDLVLLAMDLQYSLQQSLLDGADVVLRSLCSYPDALPEICCLMGAIAKFRTGQQLPGQALDYPTEEGTLGQSLQQDLSARYPSEEGSSVSVPRNEADRSGRNHILMNIGDRRFAQGLGGVGGLCVATLLLAPGDATVAIGLVGLVLVFVALGIRLRTPESRVDLVLSGTASAVILALYSQIPQPADAPYRHNDGGDVALLILWPLAWLFITFALGLWRQGCVYAHPPERD